MGSTSRALSLLSCATLASRLASNYMWTAWESAAWPRLLSRFDLFSFRCSRNAVQQECIPQAVLGMDIICQAKSGMGKTAVFVLACLQQLQAVEAQVDTLVLCHTRELAYQICQEFLRFRCDF